MTWGPARGRGSHVARLNFETSRIGVYKCFMSLSEIEKILNKETINYSSAISQLTCRVSNTYTSPFTTEWCTFNILRLTDQMNREGTVVYSVRAVGRSVVSLSTVVTSVLLTLNKKLKCGSHCLPSPIVGTTIIMMAGDWKPCDVLTSRSWRCTIFELVASRYI